MTSIFGKKQMCGNKNCKCRNGELHGPYYWLIHYKGEKSYKWTYLGKSPASKLLELGYSQEETARMLA